MINVSFTFWYANHVRNNIPEKQMIDLSFDGITISLRWSNYGYNFLTVDMAIFQTRPKAHYVWLKNPDQLFYPSILIGIY